MLQRCRDLGNVCTVLCDKRGRFIECYELGMMLEYMCIVYKVKEISLSLYLRRR